jgi:LmbE family N-acetylglucosaminyl deacetylase
LSGAVIPSDDNGNEAPLDPFEPASPVCFISPHLDDVIISCAHFLTLHPGATVVTVFTDAPDQEASPWDKVGTGAERARSAVEMRRNEDRAALATVGATPVWLPFADGLYVKEHDRVALKDAIAAALSEIQPASVVAPLGIRHGDHIAVADACLDLMSSVAADWYAYEELAYSVEWPEIAAERRAEVTQRVGNAAPLRPVPARAPAKAAVVDHYASQVPLLRRYVKTFEQSFDVPELYWRLAP